ncbi:hypothetical protein OIU76_006164 [Salix suchowensis]|nr:hypothetical protein OIU76_006164 [Salix suchowensis]
MLGSFLLFLHPAQSSLSYKEFDLAHWMRNHQMASPYIMAGSDRDAGCFYDVPAADCSATGDKANDLLPSLFH